MAELRRSLYVDDLLTGGRNTSQAQQRKEKAIQIFSDATFQLHKWHSNVKQLEEDPNLIVPPEEQSFAKQQLNVKPSESKMLGLKWDKQQDTLAVVIPKEETQPTKRGILGKMAKIYDPLGLIAPLMLTAKQIYRKLCETKVQWDAKINGELLRRWKKWEEQLPREQQVLRSIAHYQEAVQEVELHSFRMRSRSSSRCSCTPTIGQHSKISGRQESTCQTGTDYSTPRIDCSAHGYQSINKRAQRPR